MTAAAATTGRALAGLPLPLRFALRELAGGLSGLRLLAVCLFLGVAALAAVGSLSAAILEGMRDEGRAILGGDVEIRLPFREATAAERAAFARAGPVSHLSRMRAMARAGDRQQLAELKAVDGAYPLYGSATVTGAPSLAAALARNGAALAPALAESLGVRVGDTVELGRSRFRVGGIIGEEPDAAGAGFALGPTVMIARAALPATGLVQTGSIINQQYRLRLPPGTDPARAIADLKRQFPGNDWETRDRSNGAPGLRRFVVQLGQFLTLVGLTALVVAGVGVGQGVGAYLAAKTGTIATLKGLGASTARVTQSYLIQIGLVALAAVTLGMFAGGLAPALGTRLLADALPVAPAAGLQWRPMLTAALFGLLVALAFALWPLARAAVARPARLLRAGVEGAGRPAPALAWGAGAAGALLVALAVLTSNDPAFAAIFIAGAGALVGLLAAFAWGLQRLARRAARPRDPLARLALFGLARPGSPAPQLVVALGLGLTLFATLAIIETSLSAQIARSLPADAPDVVAFDVPKDGIGPLRAAVARTAPGAVVNAAASLRGPVTAVKGVPVRDLRNIPEGAWVLQGDRGLTYADEPPPGNEVVAGRWWSRGYAGPPVVSMDAEQARLIGVGLGDRITVAVLGAEIEAEVVALRKLDFTRPTLQYMFVFNRAAIEGAPHTWVATIALPEGVAPGPLKRALGRALPTASVLDIGDTVARVNGILNQVLFAVRAAAGVAIAAGIAVLVGALAAGRRARTYDAVLMKVLGATRGQVLRAAALEYGALALAVALVALAVGAGAAAVILAFALTLPFSPDWAAVAGTVAAGALVTVALGLAGSWSALSARPNRVLRTL